ncbi:unnamed protein product [Acanthoscelides obtectus]|uniref:Carboxypeptidase n=1 Tax=Acanthoscelides obtectus TaxID=200917 RepID=A0A9P0MER7_ACAOB|nr:unnamed protein product [Acanthoscelides obtectus]CAK1659267.1 hypothetical protein AOBTE_LOCUS21378 [Acanthoscelides obtectus]
MHFKLILSLTAYLSVNIPIVSSLINPHKPEEKNYLGGDVGEPLILTPLLEQNKTDEARRLADVALSEEVKSYSGYFTVNKHYNSNLFFWFFPSRGDYENDPVLLWLQGGPGSPSLYGLFMEHGPFQLNENAELELRKHAWTNNHSVIYIDNPVGAGFSFTHHKNGYARNQTQIGNELYTALQQFFVLFPELRKNEFYVTGESYAGKYVPTLAYTIYRNNPGAEAKINLKGVAIGNGYMDPLHQKGYAEYLYQLGLLDNNTSLYVKRYEEKVSC